MPALYLGIQTLRILVKENDNGGETFDPEAMAEIAMTIVEECSHFVRGNLAWKNEPEIKDQEDTYYEGLMEEFKMLQQKSEEITEALAGYEKLNFIPRFLKGAKILKEIGVKVSDYEKLDEEHTKKYLATPEEFMGLAWKRQIGEMYFSWSRAYLKVEKKYQKTLLYLKERARLKREAT